MVNDIFKMGGKNIFHVFSNIFILQVMVSCWAARAQHRAAVPALYSHLKQFSTQLQQFVWVGRIKNGGSGWRIRTSHEDQDPSQWEQDHRPGWKMCTHLKKFKSHLQECFERFRTYQRLLLKTMIHLIIQDLPSQTKFWVKLLPFQSLELICELRYWEHFSIILFCWQLYPVLLQIFQNLGIWHLLGWNF